MVDVQLSNITKRFGDVTVIPGMDLTIPDGQVTVLLGPSGCGKSTILRMIAGLEAPSDGDIRIDDEVVNAVPPVDRGCAMVFQNYALYPHKTVYKNLAFPLRMAGLGKDEIERNIGEIAEVLELGELLGRYPRQLSGGQRQRVAMGRAMIRKPKVFLYDEPLSNLDLELRVKLRIEIAKLQRELGATTVYVTHDQTEAMTLAHKVVLLRNGLIEQIGAPMELYHKPANIFVAGFIGTPRMNIFPIDDVTANGSGATLALGHGITAAVPRGLTGRPGNVGFRPEHILNGDDDGGDDMLAIEFPAVSMLAVERLGDRTFAHLHTGLGELIMLVTEESPDIDGRLRVRVPADACQFFDNDGTAMAAAIGSA